MLKEDIEEQYSVELDNVTIIKVDCEAWTQRDFQEIEWIPIVKAFLEDTLRELGYKED
jgi:hypothetical protein